jgi:hypothetical protein
MLKLTTLLCVKEIRIYSVKDHVNFSFYCGNYEYYCFLAVTTCSLVEIDPYFGFTYYFRLQCVWVFYHEEGVG